LRAGISTTADHGFHSVFVAFQLTSAQTLAIGHLKVDVGSIRLPNFCDSRAEMMISNS